MAVESALASLADARRRLETDEILPKLQAPSNVPQRTSRGHNEKGRETGQRTAWLALVLEKSSSHYNGTQPHDLQKRTRRKPRTHLTLRELPRIELPPNKRFSGDTKIDRLPQSILDRICRHACYSSLIWLRQGNKALRTAINPQLASYESKFSFALHAEKDFEQNWLNRFACYTCYIVLPRHCFERANQDAESSPHPVTERRFCIECGLNKLNKYLPGAYLIGLDNSERWICRCGCIRALIEELNCVKCGMTAPLGPKAILEGQNPQRAGCQRGKKTRTAARTLPSQPGRSNMSRLSSTNASSTIRPPSSLTTRPPSSWLTSSAVLAGRWHRPTHR